jgi:hypothetical protein
MYFPVLPTDQMYVTVEAGGRVLWDSRAVVPCDMAKWEDMRQRLGLASGDEEGLRTVGKE